MFGLVAIYSACDSRSLTERTGHTIYCIIYSGLWKSIQTMMGHEKMPLCATRTHSVSKQTSVWLMEISQLSKPRRSACQVFISFHGKPSRKVNSCRVTRRMPPLGKWQICKKLSVLPSLFTSATSEC